MSDPQLYQQGNPSQWGQASRVIAVPADTNAYGDISGGWLRSPADVVGATVAIEATGGRVATVAVNELRFLAPATGCVKSALAPPVPQESLSSCSIL